MRRFFCCRVLPEDDWIRIEETDGAKRSLRIMKDLKNRGASNVLIAVVDGLKRLAKRACRAGRPVSIRTTRL